MASIFNIKKELRQSVVTKQFSISMRIGYFSTNGFVKTRKLFNHHWKVIKYKHIVSDFLRQVQKNIPPRGCCPIVLL